MPPHFPLPVSAGCARSCSSQKPPAPACQLKRSRLLISLSLSPQSGCAPTQVASTCACRPRRRQCWTKRAAPRTLVSPRLRPGCVGYVWRPAAATARAPHLAAHPPKRALWPESSRGVVRPCCHACSRGRRCLAALRPSPLPRVHIQIRPGQTRCERAVQAATWREYVQAAAGTVLTTTRLPWFLCNAGCHASGSAAAPPEPLAWPQALSKKPSMPAVAACSCFQATASVHATYTGKC